MVDPTLEIAPPVDDDPMLAARIKATVWQRLQKAAGVDAPVASPRIGRFVVLNVIGRGGTGVVYAVYDEQLDRRAALKLIHGSASPELHARMQREARALARLSHPNVVPVFEVGNHEDLVFIVMEYVRGETLRQWVTSTRPSADDILDKYLQAGRGLAAAHAAGMVHRDFKPDNAIVGEGGRVRVLDFGLARTHDDAASRVKRDEALPLPKPGVFDTPLTVTGSIMGTPAYMASEQLLGEPSDHRSDQFAFCVSLWEALCGERPYAGMSLVEVAGNVTRGQIESPPRDARMPAWMRPLLERGLAPDPRARWPAMDDLLAALEKGRRPRRRWVWLGVGALGLATIVAVKGLAPAADDPCVDGDARIARVWNRGQRDAVRRAVASVDSPLAATTITRVDDALSTYAEDWVAGYRDACEASRVHDTQSEELMEQRMKCLADRERHFGALVGAFATITAEGVDKATQATSSLPPIASCADPSYVESDVLAPTDPALAVAIDEIDSIIAGATAHQRLASYADAQTLAEDAYTRAGALDYPPLRLRAATRLANIQFWRGEYEAALATARDGFMIADSGARADVAANLEIVGEVLCALGRYEEGLVYFRKAFALREAFPGPAGNGLGIDATLVGYALNRLGYYSEAIEQYEQALVIIERTGENHGASIRAEIANTLYLMGKPAEALELHRAALEGFTTDLGSDHPHVAQVHSEISLDLDELGRNDEAVEEATKAHAILVASKTANQRELATSHSALGNALMGAGRYDEALAHFEAVRAAYVDMKRARSHIQFAIAEENVGRALTESGRADEALASHRAYLADVVREVGPEDVAVAEARELIGRVLDSSGRPEEALAEFRSALAIRSAADSEASHALTRLDIALTLDLAGRTEEALAEYRAVIASEDADGLTICALTGAISTARRLGRLDEAAIDLVELQRVAVPYLERPGRASLVDLAEAITRDSSEGVARARERLHRANSRPGTFIADAWLTHYRGRRLSSDP